MEAGLLGVPARVREVIQGVQVRIPAPVRMEAVRLEDLIVLHAGRTVHTGNHTVHRVINIKVIAEEVNMFGEAAGVINIQGVKVIQGEGLGKLITFRLVEIKNGKTIRIPAMMRCKRG